MGDRDFGKKIAEEGLERLEKQVEQGEREDERGQGIVETAIERADRDYMADKATFPHFMCDECGELARVKRANMNGDRYMTLVLECGHRISFECRRIS